MPDYGEPDALQIRVVHTGRQWDYGPDAQQLSISWVLPGGPDTASWTISEVADYENLPPLFSHVEISDALGILWIGRLMQPHGQFRGGSADITFVALGYACAARDERYLTAKVFTAGTPLETALQIARDELCPEIDSSNVGFGVSTRRLDGDSPDFRGDNAIDIWNTICQLGDDNWRRLDWLVDNGGAGGVPILRLHATPDAGSPTLSTALRSGATGDLGWDGSRLHSRLTVFWTDADGAEQATTVDWGSVVISGRTGRFVITDQVDSVGGALGTVNDVTNYIYTVLDRYSYPYLQGTVAVPQNVAILQGADELPGWRVPVGEWMELSDFTLPSWITPYGYYGYVTAVTWTRGQTGVQITFGESKSQLRRFARTVAEQSDNPIIQGGGGTDIKDTKKDGGGGGVHILRDQFIKPVSHADGPGKGTLNVLAKVDHIHPVATAWLLPFGNGLDFVEVGHISMIPASPYAAVAVGWHLMVIGGGSVRVNVFKNGSLWRGFNGSDGSADTLPDIAIAKGDRFYAQIVELSTTSIVAVGLSLDIGKGA